MTGTVPLWLDVLTAAFVLIGAFAALMGSFGLLRAKTFFQRVHTPSVVATGGTWGVTVATVIQASFMTAQPYVHALLVTVFLGLTVPIATLFLTRAALFRARQREAPNVPPPTGGDPRGGE